MNSVFVVFMVSQYVPLASLSHMRILLIENVQGDFNLAALDLLPDAGLYWVGNCNELNAGKLSFLNSLSLNF